jgi:ornithine--oxo-acid transaminase
MNARLPTAALSRPTSPIALEERYGASNYLPLHVVLTRGEGAYLWDDAGRRYLDMMSAYSAVSFGHSHPALVEALTRQAQRLAITSRAFHSDRLGPFLRRLCEATGMARALPMNSGAEAVETALKAARKWGYKVKGIAEGRARIIVAAGNFAGRTTTIVGFSSEAQYRDGFGPFAPGFASVPFGDAQALEAAITPDTCAFLVEPIQGEAGIVVPPAGYLRAAREICTRRNVLMICDEIQTGLGRTGALLACDHEGVRPDGLTLGKALGGGLLPVSAFLAREDVMAVFTPGDHGSTFGGNPLAAAVGEAALELLQRERLAERARETGEYLMDVSRGFAPARRVCEELMREGVLTKDTHDTVVRLAPPLIVTREQIDFTVDALARVLARLS